MAEWTGSNVEITLVVGVRCHISLMSIRYNRGSHHQCGEDYTGVSYLAGRIAFNGDRPNWS